MSGGIVSPCADDLGSRESAERVLAALSARLRLDGAWLHTADPATFAWTSCACSHESVVVAPFIENEYLQDDFAKFEQLARRATPVAILSDETGGEPERSRRYAGLLKPFGLAHEMRAALVAGGACWGGLCLVRAADGRDFRPSDAARVARLAESIALALRSVALRAGPPPSGDDSGPGTLLLDRGGAVVSLSPGARDWLRELDGSPEDLPTAVRAVAARARARARGADGPAARAALRTAHGRWIELHGTALERREEAAAAGEEIAITIGAARPRMLAPTLVAAFGLSARERDVLALLLRGHTLEEIARALVISRHTVRDHIKAIYSKAGVARRPELSARMLALNIAPPPALAATRDA